MNINGLMKNYRITLEGFLYLLAFLLALWLRLVQLGVLPLSDYEAGWALQALEVSAGRAPVVMGPQPGYVLLTGFIFWLFGASNFAARFFPALFGALLVFLPFLIGRKLFPPLQIRWDSGVRAANLGLLILAFALALEPGLVALSRQAGSPVSAVSLSLLALALAWLRRPILAGISAGLALLMGPAVFHGALGLVLAWGIAKLLNRVGALAPLEPSMALPPESFDVSKSWTDQDTALRTDGSALPSGAAVYPLKAHDISRPDSRFWRLLLFSAGLTIVLVGTLLFRYPSGLSAFASSLPAYLRGWAPSSQVESGWVPALRLLVALPIYTTFGLIFGLLGLVMIWIRPDLSDPGYGLLQRLSLWLVAALLLAVIYPGRGMGDLAWVLVPLWFLAASQLARLLRVRSPVSAYPSWLSILLAALIFILFALFWLNLAGLTSSAAGSQVFALRLGVMFGVIALGVLATALVGLGWSWDIAARGSVLGMCLVLGAAMIATAWGTARLRSDYPSLAGAVVPQELWDEGPLTAQPDGLLDTLGELGEWGTGWPKDVDIALAVDSPSLQWALREFPKVNLLYASAVNLASLDNAPAVVITSEGAQAPSLPAAYRGQAFAWRIFPAWSGVLPPDFFRWWAFREAPARIERVILWARADLFPGGDAQEAGPGVIPVETP